MAEATELKAILARSMRELRDDPAAGKGTATTTVRVHDGLTCDIADGAWRLVADEMPRDGGAGLGPDPGVFVRAGLGGCLAMGYVMWAAYLGVPIDGVEVVVEADYDAHGMFGIDDAAPPGWTAVRYTATIASPAAPERVRTLVETADRYSSVLDVLRRAIPVSRDLRVTPGTHE